MRTETFSLPVSGGKQLRAVLWLPETEPVGIIQLTHGMTEHTLRWAGLAAELAERGVIVAGFDIRGHGEDRGAPGVAGFAEGDWHATLEDMRALFLLLQARFPGLPHHMLGFSLGSFLLREYLGLWPEGIASAVLVGTGHQPAALLSIMGALVKTQVRKAGWMETTPLVGQLSLETYNKRFSPKRTVADWLCADEEQLDGYLNDPLCRKQISAGLFWHLLAAMKRCASPAACNNWNKKLPVLLLSGAEDPVGSMGKGVKTVQKNLLRGGMERVELELFPGARHDLFHEESSGAALKAREKLCSWLAAFSQAAG